MRTAGGGPGRRRGPHGQAAVELALLLPLLMLMALFLAQMALTARDQIMVTHSAREAARAVAVSDDLAGARPAALAASRLDPERLRVRVKESPDGNVSVTLDYRSAVRFAPLGAVLDDLTLSGRAVMRLER